MSTLTAGSEDIVRPNATRAETLRKVLLVCGILSSLLYVATTIIGALTWEGYSSSSQTVSELFAIGAPSRPFVVPLLYVYSFLVIAFGMGIRGAAGRNRALRVVAGLLIAYGAIGLFGPHLAPMHLRGEEGTLTDTMHIILTMVLVLLMMLALGFGAAAFGRRFRLYSIGTIVALVVFGALAGMSGPRIAANLPTPWVGVLERINIGTFMLWIIVLTVALLRAGSAPPNRAA